MAASSLKDVHILIVDDDSDVLLTLCSLFDSFGFSVHTAGDVFSAYRVVEERPIQLVLSDIRMPNSNGVDLLRMLRVRNVEEPKLLFVSGYSDYKIEDLYDLGAEGQFLKPFSAHAVRNAIRMILLQRLERWKPGSVARTAAVLDTKKYPTKGIHLGRGGFFLELDPAPLLPINSEIGFKLDYKPGCPLEGFGIIRWTRVEAGAEGPSGMGIEILELSDNCREAVVKEIESDPPISYIPKN